jgi:hypothetical protein
MIQKHLGVLLIALTCSVLISCSEIKTSDPIATYDYWMKDYIPDDVEILNGEYWESAHWSKEYVVYMKLRPSMEWWDKFRTAYDLTNNRIDEIGVEKAEIFKIDDPQWLKKPIWFRPATNSEVFGQFGGSKYFWDSKNKILYIYEIQL